MLLSSLDPGFDTLQGTRATDAAETSDEDDDYQELPSSRASDADSDGSDADTESQKGMDGAKDAAVIDEGVSDLDYLKSRMTAGVGQRGNEDKTSSQTSSLTDTRHGAHEQSLPCLLPKLVFVVHLGFQAYATSALVITGDDTDEEDAEGGLASDGQEEEGSGDGVAAVQDDRQASHAQASTKDVDTAMTDVTDNAGESLSTPRSNIKPAGFSKCALCY